MSKERELLKRWFNEIGKIQSDIKLLRDTQELLAQPEPEQEPFAWCIESKNSADRCFAADKIGVIENSKLLDEECDRSVPFPLYTSPERKPLSDDEMDNLYYIAAQHYEHTAIKQFGRLIEKAHGIGVNNEL